MLSKSDSTGLNSEFVRQQSTVLLERLREPRRFIQVVFGPRQVGKTTLVRQAFSRLDMQSILVSADEPALRDKYWLAQMWESARRMVREPGFASAVLAIDEIQKISGWSETVKRLWDEDTAKSTPLKIVLLGSAPWLVQRGLTESLSGRFELIRVPHWNFTEMNRAFNIDLEQFLFYGGYPGAAALIKDPSRWARYVIDSLIETSITRDILMMNRVDKPVLLRRLFEFGCRYSGQILSFNKMLGQLQDAGNTTTLAHYLELLSGAGLITGVQKFSGQQVRVRASSPKLLVLNTALMTSVSGLSQKEFQNDSEQYGRLCESAIGAYLANSALVEGYSLYYWREGEQEVDYVLRSGSKAVAIEVKSGRPRAARSGLRAFARIQVDVKPLLVGSDGISIKDFLTEPVSNWFN